MADQLPRSSQYLNSSEQYTASKTTFAGSDIEVLFFIPAANGNFVSLEMNNIQTLTCSVFREKHPVRALGFIGEKGEARGTRTIAGSIVFTVFDQHPLLKMMSKHLGSDTELDTNAIDKLEYTMPDQLPPFNAVIKFSNELGRDSELVLFGLSIQSEGQVHSIHDMLTENTMQYRAQHMAVMRPGGYKSALNAVDNYVEVNHGGRKSYKTVVNNSAAYSEELRNMIYKSINPFR